jgi:hypothetical protein
MSTKTASKSYEHRGRRPNPVKNPGPPNRKIKAKLDARVRDYAAMVSRVDFKAPDGAYHRPGSMKK